MRSCDWRRGGSSGDTTNREPRKPLDVGARVLTHRPEVRAGCTVVVEVRPGLSQQSGLVGRERSSPLKVVDEGGRSRPNPPRRAWSHWVYCKAVLSHHVSFLHRAGAACALVGEAARAGHSKSRGGLLAQNLVLGNYDDSMLARVRTKSGLGTGKLWLNHPNLPTRHPTTASTKSLSRSGVLRRHSTRSTWLSTSICWQVQRSFNVRAMPLIR